jgi:ABC-2 type transport system permease protein
VARQARIWPAFRALYGLLLRNQATKGRMLALGALGLLGVVVAPLSISGSHLDATIRGTRFVDAYCLSILAPVVSLVFGSGALGDLVEDRSLVYLWLPPVPRWVVAAAAWVATVTNSLPFVVGMSMLTAITSGGGSAVVQGAFWASLVAMIAYTGVFTALGLRFRRALVWGLAYVLIWENFVARAGDGTARLSVLSYARSVLSAYTGAGLNLANRELSLSFIVPIGIGLLGVVYTARRLRRQDVD